MNNKKVYNYYCYWILIYFKLYLENIKVYSYKYFGS